MKKGCVIAIVVVVILGIIGGIVGFFLVKKGMGIGQSTALYVVEESIKNYAKASPGTVPAETTNEAWAAVLQGTDHDNIKVQGRPLNLELDQFIHDGKLTDFMGQTPLVLQKGGDGTVSAILPGPDGQVGTEDDVTSASFRKLLEMGQ